VAVTRIVSATVLVLCTGLLGACAGHADTGSGDPEGADPAPTPRSQGAQPDATEEGDGPTVDAQQRQDPTPETEQDEAEGPSDAGETALTDADDGATFALVVGEERALQLDSAWAWDEPATDSPTIVLTRVDHLVDPGYAEWIVAATQPGSATLVARGAPNCDDPAACPERTIRLTIEVSG
jgi:predicted secreted protein